MASEQARQNRREVRRLRTLSRRERAERRRAREAQTSRRMVDRFFAGRVIHLLLMDYRYWQARRCGWNPLSPLWRQTGAKDPAGRDVLYPPYASPLWLWWCRLHWTQRDELARMSPHTLRRASNSLPSATYLMIQKDLAES